MVKKTLFILFMAVLVVSLLVGCGGGGETVTPIELVPQKANMIGLIDLSQIMSDEDIAELYDEDLDLAMEESGLDLRDFREGLIFGEVSEATGDMDYFGIMVKGTFEESYLIAAIEQAAEEELITVEYQGYEIYTEPYEEMGLAFLGSDAFVIGSMDAVKDVIEVNKGAQPAINGKLLNTYNGLSDALMKVAMIVPPGAIEEGLQEFTAELPIPLPGLDKLADMDTVGITLTKNGQSISLVSRMCFTSSDSAEVVETLISFVISMAVLTDIPEGIQELLPDIPEEALELLENLDVSVSGSCLDISLEMTMSEIESLIETAIEAQ